jgi:hypothetical protein
MTYAELTARLNEDGFEPLGGFHPEPDEDHLPADCKTLVLVGPRADFWTYFTAHPEWNDGDPDPVDRFSNRALSTLAAELNGTALFPFGGAPFLPFYSWALRSGAAWESPVKLLVHAQAGLMVSYRGALALPERIDLPPNLPRPCGSCAAPCLTSCESGALTGEGYDVPRCKAFLGTAAGAESLAKGCAVRRACPISQSYARMEAQSAYHMRIFVGESR